MDSKQRTADTSGRISLGPEAARTTYFIETDPTTGVITPTPQLVVTPDMVSPEVLQTLRERAAAARDKLETCG